AVVRRSGVQNSAMGILSRPRHAGGGIRTSFRRHLCDARSQTDAGVVGGSVQHPTLTSDQARGELEKIATFTGFTRTSEQIDFERDFYTAMMEGLLQSESWIAVVMITDLLARKYRFNIPGTAASSNWVRRMQRSISQLRSSPKERKRMQVIRTLLEKSGRI